MKYRVLYHPDQNKVDACHMAIIMQSFDPWLDCSCLVRGVYQPAIAIHIGHMHMEEWWMIRETAVHFGVYASTRPEKSIKLRKGKTND